MRSIKRHILTLLSLLAFTAAGAEIVRPMSPARLVNDFAGILPANEAAFLEQKLRAFADTTSTQITVVTVNDLEGEDIAQYATDLAHAWGVGQQGKDNGVVILVKPKRADSQGEVFIAVGYGLEGALPDATAKEIVDREMIPAFRQNQYGAGIDRAASVIMQITAGEYTADKYHESAKGFNKAYLFIILILLVFLFTPRKREEMEIDGREAHAGTSSALPFFLLGSMLGSSHRRGGNDFGSFSGGGGSFGGFGGGGFGGGGAGGSW